jgi:glycosyltransferase involved in cell wall biosynthesis
MVEESLPHDEVLRVMGGAAMLLVPSVCLEMQPTVVAEALGYGVPVVAVQGNGAADIVEQYGCGETYGAVPIATAIESVLARGDELREHSRDVCERHFAPNAWTERLVQLYESVISGRSGRQE